MIRGRLTLSILILFGFINHVHSQTIEQQILLENNPALLKDITKKIDEKNNRNFKSGMPSSPSARQLNADDVRLDSNSLVQSVAPVETAESVIQRYYGVLAGEKLPVYGAKEFSQEQDPNLVFFNTIGKNYRLAPGDVVRITLRGRTQSSDSYKIKTDGSLILPNLAPITVSGMSIVEAEERLLDILQIDDASAAVFVSLDTARLIAVQISGAVKSPRTVSVPAYTPLSRVLAYAGGVSDTGSLRQIFLIDNVGNTQTVDFYDFLQSPLGGVDPLVIDSSRVFVGTQGKTVAAAGLVANPGIYELKDSDTDILVSKLLELTGTKIIPPGIEFEVLYFGENGITTSRKVDPSGVLKAGEVLNLRFIETKYDKAINIIGAVLSEYKLSVSKPTLLGTALKQGSVLKQDAFLDYCLVIIPSTGEVRAINLRSKINDPSFFVSPGSTVLILNQDTYNGLVSDQSSTLNSFLKGMVERSDHAELFFDGIRIGLVPAEKNISFRQMLRPFYRIQPDTNLDLFIIESGLGTANAFRLNSMLSSNQTFSVNSRDKLHLFSNSFLSKVSQRVQQGMPDTRPSFENGSNTRPSFENGSNTRPSFENGSNTRPSFENGSNTRPSFENGSNTRPSFENGSNTRPSFENGSNTRPSFVTDQVMKASDKWAAINRLFSRAGVFQLMLDDRIIAFLPAISDLTPSIIMDFIGYEVSSTLSDLVLILSNDRSSSSSFRVTSLTSNQSLGLNNKTTSVRLFSAFGLKELIFRSDQGLKKDIQTSALSLYIDGSLEHVGVPSDLVTTNSKLFQATHDSEIYPLFALHSTFDQQRGFWKTQNLDTAELESETFVRKINVGDKIQIFSHAYLRSVLHSDDQSSSDSQLAGAEAMEALSDRIDEKTGYSDKNQSLSAKIREAKKTSQASETSNNTPINIQRILSSSRFISGAVEYPGFYPIANNITLDRFVSAAGGLIKSADTKRIEIVRNKIENGRILIDKIDVVDLNNVHPSSIQLAGQYSVNIPNYINDAATGVVTLEGEITRPGKYLIRRDETLHGIIERAGGFTSVAYPLGAIFTRESLKQSQRESNNLLANQVEEAVLSVSQAEDKSGVGEQIKAVLSYAQQLRRQEVTGRLSVNVLQRDKSGPVYLQSGDVLVIPKRPGHVSVIGSVQKDTVVSYSESKDFNSYIATAGGLTRIADRSRSYIVLPNGESEPAQGESIIPPGSVIVVPPKTDRLSALSFTEVASRILGNIALSVLAINNVR